MTSCTLTREEIDAINARIERALAKAAAEDARRVLATPADAAQCQQEMINRWSSMPPWQRWRANVAARWARRWFDVRCWVAEKVLRVPVGEW